MSPTKKNKLLSQYHLKNDIANQQLHSNVPPYGTCRFCPKVNTATGNCREREIIYAAQCFKHKILYIGHTGEQLSERFSKDHYGIKNRPENSELVKHFHKSHNLNDNLNVNILQNNIKTVAARRYHKDTLNCKLKTLALHGLNIEIGDYVKEMYNFYLLSNELCHKFRYYVHVIMKNMENR